jgi:uncharacterized membrane protein (DUF373 family)
MEKLAGWFENFAVTVLMLLLMATILYGTVLVGWSLVEDLRHVQDLAAEPKALFDIFGLFVGVLVGVELLKILRHLVLVHEVDTALVTQTAMIALCNKVITINLSSTSWTTLIAIAALILALTAATFALKQPRA